MNLQLRDAALSALLDGRSNHSIAAELGVTVNAVAGLRWRNFPPRFSQQEALEAANTERARQVKARNPLVLAVIAASPGCTRADLLQALPDVSVKMLRNSLRELIADRTVIGVGRNGVASRYSVSPDASI